MREDIRKWIEELRSGKYQQTQETLKEEFPDGTCGHCCLGVYLEGVRGIRVAANKRFDSDEDSAGYLYEGKQSHYNLVEKSLPEVCNLAPGWNDDQKLTFSEIADKIEEIYSGT